MVAFGVHPHAKDAVALGYEGHMLVPMVFAGAAELLEVGLKPHRISFCPDLYIHSMSQEGT
jgi:hypothetical protein